MIAVLLALALAIGQEAPAAGGSGERIVEITVHGNVLTPDDEVRRLSGLAVGTPLGPSTVDDAAARLRASKKFQSVDVRKRYASIADPTEITIVIIVEEGAVHVERPQEGGPARVVKNRLPRLLFLPILDAEDGYGLSYGVRLRAAGRTWREQPHRISRVVGRRTAGGDRVRQAARLG